MEKADYIEERLDTENIGQISIDINEFVKYVQSSQHQSTCEGSVDELVERL